MRVTGLPDSPQALAWSPDGRRIAYSMNVPDEGTKLGTAPDKPEGANWAKPLEVIDKVTYRADGAGYIKPGFDKIFMVDADGGAPRQLTFGAYHDGAPEWTPDGRAILFSAAAQARLGNGRWSTAKSTALDIDSGAVTALTTPRRPRRRAGSVARRPDRSPISASTTTQKGFEQSHIYVMDINGGAPRLVAPDLDRNVQQIEWAADGRSLYAAYEEGGSVTVSRHRPRRQRPPDRARRRRRRPRPALCRRRIQRLEGRRPSPSPSAPADRPPTSRVVQRRRRRGS